MDEAGRCGGMHWLGTLSSNQQGHTLDQRIYERITSIEQESRAAARKPRDAACFCLYPMSALKKLAVHVSETTKAEDLHVYDLKQEVILHSLLNSAIADNLRQLSSLFKIE